MSLKKRHHRALHNPPKDAIVICIDEDGPLSVRPYSGSTWAKAGYPKRIRATYLRTEAVVQMVAAFNRLR